MKTSHFLVLASLLMWAGLSIGGAFLAAPAKFTVDELGLSLALQVGRAQFLWLSYAEYVFALILLTCLLTARLWIAKWPYLLLPVGLFFIQQWLVLPELNTATTEKIAGISSTSDLPHLIYVLLECLKLIALLFVAYLATHKVGSDS